MAYLSESSWNASVLQALPRLFQQGTLNEITIKIGYKMTGDMAVYGLDVSVAGNGMEEIVSTSYQWGYCCSYLASSEAVCEYFKGINAISFSVFLGVVLPIIAINDPKGKIYNHNVTTGDYVVMGIGMGIVDIASLCALAWGALKIIKTCNRGINRGYIRGGDALLV